MQKSTIQKQVSRVHKQGFVQKQSRFLKTWRQQLLITYRRWLVLTDNLLLTFKERKKYSHPTQVIILKEIVAVKTMQDIDKPNSFKVQTNQTVFYFSCQTSLMKEQWIGTIGKIMIKSNQKYDQ